MKKLKNKAFTLIELLVVVAIIGILAAVGVTTFGGFQDKAKVSASKAIHKGVQKKLAASALSQTKSSNQTGSDMEEFASKVLKSDKYNETTKKLAGSVLSQSNKER